MSEFNFPICLIVDEIDLNSGRINGITKAINMITEKEIAFKIVSYFLKVKSNYQTKKTKEMKKTKKRCIYESESESDIEFNGEETESEKESEPKRRRIGKEEDTSDNITTSIYSFPTEIMVHMFTFLEEKECARVSIVCKNWLKIIRESNLDISGDHFGTYLNSRCLLNLDRIIKLNIPLSKKSPRLNKSSFKIATDDKSILTQFLAQGTVNINAYPLMVELICGLTDKPVHEEGKKPKCIIKPYVVVLMLCYYPELRHKLIKWINCKVYWKEVIDMLLCHNKQYFQIINDEVVFGMLLKDLFEVIDISFSSPSGLGYVATQDVTWYLHRIAKLSTTLCDKIAGEHSEMSPIYFNAAKLALPANNLLSIEIFEYFLSKVDFKTYSYIDKELSLLHYINERKDHWFNSYLSATLSIIIESDYFHNVVLSRNLIDLLLSFPDTETTISDIVEALKTKFDNETLDKYLEEIYNSAKKRLFGENAKHTVMLVNVLGCALDKKRSRLRKMYIKR
jgi:hypothetical protein